MEKRIFGIETEFGCMVRDPSLGSIEEVVEAVKDHAFYEKRLGVIDLHARDYAFEPARAGGFLRKAAGSISTRSAVTKSTPLRNARTWRTSSPMTAQGESFAVSAG